MLKPDHSLAWNNMVILLDNTGKVELETDHILSKGQFILLQTGKFVYLLLMYFSVVWNT